MMTMISPDSFAVFLKARGGVFLPPSSFFRIHRFTEVPHRGIAAHERFVSPCTTISDRRFDTRPYVMVSSTVPFPNNINDTARQRIVCPRIERFMFIRKRLYVRAVACLLGVFLFVALPAAADSFTIPSAIASQGVFSCGDMTMSGGGTIDSAGVASSGPTNKGTVRSNGKITISSSTVNGDAIPGPGKTVSISGSGNVTGTTTAATTSAPCTPINLSTLGTSLSASNNNATIPLTGQGKSVLAGANHTEFSMSGGDTLTLPAGTYYFTKFTVSGGSTITLAGPARILVTGNVSISGGSFVNSNAYSFRLWHSGATFSLSSSTFTGIIYAPASSLTISSSRFIGSVFAGDVTISGGTSHVTRSIDDVAPSVAITSPATGAGVSDPANVVVRGTVADAQTDVTVSVNGQAATVAADGTWQVTLNLTGSASPVTVSAIATDAAGNSSTATISVVTAAPAISLLTPPPGALLGARIVNLAGSAGTATSVTVNGTTAVLAGGSWSLANVDLGADGSHTLTITGINGAGATSISPVLTTDTTAPSVTATVAPAPNAAGWNQSTATVTFTCSDATSGVASCPPPLVVSAETASQVVSGTATDNAGNHAAASVTVKLDKTAPSLAITVPATNATTTSADLAVSGTVSDALSGIAIVTCNGTAATVTTGAFTCTVTLIAGDNTITVIATDIAGNPTTATILVSYNRDSQPPTIAVTSPTNGTFTKNSSIPVSGTASDDVAVASVTVNGSAVTLTNGTWTTNVPLSGGDGAKPITAVATDTAGKQSTVTINVVVDTTAPSISVAVTPAPNAAGWNKAPVTASFTCADAGSGIANCPSAAAVATDVASQVVSGTAVDNAGNSANTSTTIKLDQTPPVLTVTTPADQAKFYGATATLTGTASDALSGLASVTCKGSPATMLTSTSFSCTVTLDSGSNSVPIVATDVAGNQTLVTRTLIYTADTTVPVIRADVSAVVVDGWTHGPVSVSFTCADLETGIAVCPDAVTLSNEGANQTVRGTGIDKAGNRATATVTLGVDNTAPQLTVSNTQTIPLSANSVVLTGSVQDSLSGLTSIACNGTDAMLSGSTFTCTLPLANGTNPVNIVAVDRVGNRRDVSVATVRDSTAPVIAIAAPSAGTSLNAATVVITGTATDDDQLASVVVNGVAASRDGADFTASVALANGANTITAVATDRAGNVASAVTTVNRFAIPGIAITAPVDLAIVSESLVHVRGTIDDPAATVQVNGTPASISGGAFAADVPLAQGRTVITAMATSASGHIATSSVNIYRDAIPPRVVIYDPPDNALLFSPKVTVSGMVDDIVVGTVNAGQVRLTINGIPAMVSNRAFVVPDLPLVSGNNVFDIVATDQAGNTTSFSRSVYYDDFPYPLKLSLVSGSLQSAPAATRLPQPLVVRLADIHGVPLGGRSVSFRVVVNDGTVAAGNKSGRSVDVLTDAQGYASVQWTLGTRTGAGNNRVEAQAEGLLGAVEFVATAIAGDPFNIVIDVGDGQFGVTAAPLARPLVAVALDAGGNRVAGVPVTFTVVDGGGSFDHQPSVTVISDSDGRASARPILGSDAGSDNNVFRATAPGAAFEAVFRASGRVAGDAANTRITGVVLDNTQTPVPGVSLRIDGSTIVQQSDAQGRFTLSGVPVGYVKLFVDGSTSTRAGTWPTLEFPMYTIAGQDNEIGMPVYLLPIDIARGLSVDDTHGGTLTLPELPGFSLTIGAGTATFPGGGRTGTVSVTLVHADKMPMAPSAGQQPRFIVTIQPPGVHFDPPAAISFPNVDGLAPGQIAEMFSFDHDLGQFVTIGTGTVSEDGSTLRSDVGVGIIKGGWHGSSEAPTTGTAAKCNECKVASAGACIINADKAGKPCKDDGDPCTEDICTGGNCVHNQIVVRIGGITTETRNVYADHDDPSRTLSDAIALTAGQPIYSNPTAGDLVAWRAFIENVSMRARVTQYKWTATGPETHTGPAASEWLVGNMNWRPGTYTITCEIKFDTGCKKTATYQQKVGMRTNDYIIFGVITQALPEPATDVSIATKAEWHCPGISLALAFATTFGAETAFNAQTVAGQANPFFVPEAWPDRHYVNYRLINATYDTAFTGPLNLDKPWANTLNPTAFGVSSLNGFRQAIHVQFKYLIDDGGHIMATPQPVGEVYARPGQTPATCTDAIGGPLFGFVGEAAPDNERLEIYPDRTGFTYLMKVRAGSHAQDGYQALNRRELPYVYFRARFEAYDPTLRSHVELGSGSSPDGPTGNYDYSPVPTFYAYQRIWESFGAYDSTPLQTFPLYMDLEKFLNISKPLGTGQIYPP